MTNKVDTVSRRVISVGYTWHRLIAGLLGRQWRSPKTPHGDRQQTPPTPGGGSAKAFTSRFYLSQSIGRPVRSLRSHRLGEKTGLRDRPRTRFSGVFLQFCEDELGNFLQRIEDSLTGHGDGFDRRLTLDGELLGELLDRKDIR